MDGRNQSARQQPDSEEEEEEEEEENEEGESQGAEAEWHSTTDPVRPQTTDR